MHTLAELGKFQLDYKTWNINIKMILFSMAQKRITKVFGVNAKAGAAATFLFTLLLQKKQQFYAVRKYITPFFLVLNNRK